MLEVAEGVEYIHSEGIVHGDLRGVRVLISCFVNTFDLFAA
jgi:serine/threonine protein kinase